MLHNLLTPLIFGKDIERFKLFTTVYLLFVSGWSTNYYIGTLGYHYSAQSIDLKVILNFFLASPISIAIVITFVMSYCFWFFGIRLLLNVLSLIFVLMCKVIMSFAIAFILVLLFRWKHLKGISKLVNEVTVVESFVLIPYFNIIIIKEGKKFKGKNFGNYRKIVQDLELKEPLESVYVLTTIFISTIVTYYLYNLQEVFPGWVELLLVVASTYSSFNAMLLIRLENKTESLKEILLQANELNPAQ